MNWNTRLRRGAAVLVVAGVVVAGAPGLAMGETVPVPSNAATGSNASVELFSSSCAAAGGCVEVGSYSVAAGTQGLIETETNGTWNAVEAPTTGISAGYAQLDDVSCASAGSCVAVGTYDDAANKSQVLIETDANGVWTNSELPLTGIGASGNELVLSGVSCSSPGNCAAVGAYSDAGGHEEGLILTDSGGTWTAHEVNISGLGGSSAPSVQLNGVSCGGTGSCAAVGYFSDSSNHVQGLLDTEVGGTWTASKVNLSSLPSVATNPNVSLSAVSCSAAGNCTAVGRYVDGSAPYGSYQALVLSSTNSSWSVAAKVALPADASFIDGSVTAQRALGVPAVSCSSPGNCMVVGMYEATSNNIQEAFVLSQQGGTWSAGVEQSTPTAGASNPFGQLDSVSCFAAGACKAVGFYQASGGGEYAWVLSQSGATTSSAAVPVLPAAAVAGGATLSCSPGGYCAAAGWLANPSVTTPFLLDSPAAAGAPTATASGTSAQVSWSAPADTGGLPVTGYTITATDLTAPGRGGQTVTIGDSTSATVTGLTAGDTYTFAVTPASLLGNGLPATTPAVQVPLAPQHPVSISTQQLTTSLVGLLAPHGAAARLKRLRKTHSYTFGYRPLESGKVSVRWYEMTGRHKHRHRHLVAAGSAATTGTTPVTVHVRLTSFGRRAVKAGRRLKLTAVVTFASGSVSVRRTHTFTLR